MTSIKPASSLLLDLMNVCQSQTTATYQGTDGEYFGLPSQRGCSHVDTTLNFCSCFMGKTGAPCKHQFAVLTHCHIDSCNFQMDGDHEDPTNCSQSLIPAKRPKKAPHSLSTCVARNQNVGKTHSAR
ncbi:uncharacterized protein [Apostichopus japonicus]|uniref:uncharacterized protein n=1 Tax=Stichopus japonicus TaxID=307972 RepID=UPI003AB64314